MTNEAVANVNHSIQIRIAAPADAEKITAVINSAFRIVEEFFIAEDRTTLKEVERLLATGTFLLAETNGIISGCVYVEPRGNRAYLGLLSVDPSQQQGGIGSLLMVAGEDYCREKGARFIDIYMVNLRKDLPTFYHRRGYVETGTEPFPPEVETRLPCHFIKMSKALS